MSIKNEMLLASNWDCIVVGPYMNDKFIDYATSIGEDADDFYDEVGMSCFVVWDIMSNIDTFADDILNENFDWRITLADRDDFQPEDIEPRYLYRADGKWQNFDLNLQNMIA